jgi:hypothetical protein
MKLGKTRQFRHKNARLFIKQAKSGNVYACFSIYAGMGTLTKKPIFLG